MRSPPGVIWAAASDVEASEEDVVPPSTLRAGNLAPEAAFAMSSGRELKPEAPPYRLVQLSRNATLAANWMLRMVCDIAVHHPPRTCVAGITYGDGCVDLVSKYSYICDKTVL